MPGFLNPIDSEKDKGVMWMEIDLSASFVASSDDGLWEFDPV